ncbi:glutathione S-transferase family protein [Phenylobacterium sp.]|uniref:glutathione S-transferase family protein n=1 Tax=Phenylobacterium sp. TaxID=1871053 RepID=UPI0027276CE2|nr:glutathione S-transferase family protein [Phenylobacterium sp.]MDO8377515.1 glutathione S-transferase family protein [Phenylobacterium sp.]
MSTLVLHSIAMSPYGWAAALTAAEKGVDCEIVPIPDAGTPERVKLHPFGKMPVLQHGDLYVYETLAIAHYIDRAFEGPALQPADAKRQTDMLRWISIVSSYVFPLMNGLIKERAAAFWRGDPPNDAALAAMREPLAHQFGLIDAAVGKQPFLAGDQLTLADLFLAPHLHLVSTTPEGQEALGHAPGAAAWLELMRACPTFEATNPLTLRFG